MKRSVCPKCQRPQKVCLCPWLERIDNDFHLTILRHKSETRHALNTVNILANTLTRCRVFDGEVFDAEQVMRGPHSIVVFPGASALSWEVFSKHPPGPEEINLILVDGTWGKARKVFYVNPWLQQLPSLKLPVIASRYILRGQTIHGFSTLEACHFLLSQLEQDVVKYQPLFTALAQMMQFQIDAMGPETFHVRYPGVRG